jgi:hypothetical protein
MSTDAIKVIGTTVSFNGNPLGRVVDVGRSTMSRNEQKIVTCDSDDDDAEYLSTDADRGTLAFTLNFQGMVADTWSTLNTAWAAETEGTLLVTFRNGATKSTTAKCISLETPGGAADGGYYQYGCTFRLIGTITYTPAAAA